MSTRDKTTILGWLAVTLWTLAWRHPIMEHVGEPAMGMIAILLGVTGILIAADIAARNRE